jgi:hypothetical protein
MVKEGTTGGSAKPEILKSFNSRTRNMVENIVIDWMTKYYIDDSNLAVSDYDDPAQIQNWVKGVWGRITHQILGSGLPRSGDLEKLAAHYFNDQISGHKFYDRIRPHLPGQAKKVADAEERPTA